MDWIREQKKYPPLKQGTEAQKGKVMRSFTACSQLAFPSPPQTKKLSIHPDKIYKLIFRYKPALGALLPHHQQKESLTEANN